MIATLTTVRTVLFTKARTTMPSRVASTSARFSPNAQFVGQENSSRDASDASLAAVRKMNANGTRKTTTDARMAEDTRGRTAGSGAPHRSTSLRLSSIEIGTMTAVTTRKRITLPAVDSP